MGFLFVDRIWALSPRHYARGIKHITYDDTYLIADNPRPYFAPSLIGETLGQLAAWNVMSANDFSHRPVAGVVGSATLHSHAYVGDTLLLEIFIDDLDEVAVRYHGTATVNGKPVFTLDSALGPLLPMSTFIATKRVRAQFADVYRPDEDALTTVTPQGLVLPEMQGYNSAFTYDSFVVNAGVSMTAWKKITRAALYFADHFPRSPVLPMTILLECKRYLAKEFLKAANFPHNYHVKSFNKIKMNHFVRPGDVLVTHVQVHRQDAKQLVLRYRSEVEGVRVCVADILLEVS